MEKDRIVKALQGAIVTRGKRKGMLLAKCPPVGTDAAAAWQAVMTKANPYKASITQMFFMPIEQRELFDTIRDTLDDSGIDCRHMDRDRKALETLGVW